MLDYTVFRIAQQEYGEMTARRPATEGIRIAEAGPLRRWLAGLGGLLAGAGRRLTARTSRVARTPSCG